MNGKPSQFVNCRDCGSVNNSRSSICRNCGYKLQDVADRKTGIDTQRIDPGVVVSFAVDRWLAEVSNRPLVNVHRRTLDDTWRQVIRRFGGDPEALLGPSHDTLLAQQGKA
jgi:hypothetical protein